MKRCPNCSRTFTDESLNFCLEDGTPLVDDTALDPGATLRYTDSRHTSPPVTEIYPPPAPTQPPASQTPRPPRHYEATPPVRPVSPVPSSQWAPVPAMPPRQKSKAVWWILGGIVVAGVILVGAAILILTLARIGANSNRNTNTNANTRNSNSRTNRNSNTVTNANNANVNSNANLPATTTDDFSEEKWERGTLAYGNSSYVDGEYRMRSKERSYLVMFGPSPDYSTENATVRVAARSVNGSVVTTGYGLIVHRRTPAGAPPEDYALLVSNGDQPQYQIVKHKAGIQITMVPWTASSAVLTGDSTNQLEVRTKGFELSFYINGVYVNRITDNKMKPGLAGLYTSGTNEVAFDNLEIKR